MDFDELQKTWQSKETHMARIADLDAVLEQVQERHRRLMRTVLWRDVREMAASALVAGFFVWFGATGLLGAWPLYVAAALALGVGVLMGADRLRQRRRAAAFGASARESVRRALSQVDHQIWLLKNVLWWYLLPLAVGEALVLVQVASVARRLAGGPHFGAALAVIGGTAALCLAVLYGVYRLNQAAVRRYLLPRRRELAALARTFEEEAEQAADEGVS